MSDKQSNETGVQVAKNNIDIDGLSCELQLDHLKEFITPINAISSEARIEVGERKLFTQAVDPTNVAFIEAEFVNLRLGQEMPAEIKYPITNNDTQQVGEIAIMIAPRVKTNE